MRITIVSGYADSFMERRDARKRLNRFEDLIREAIALLVKQGEIKIPPKERPASQPTNITSV